MPDELGHAAGTKPHERASVGKVLHLLVRMKLPSLEVVIDSMAKHMEHDVFLFSQEVTERRAGKGLQIEISRAGCGFCRELELANAIEAPAFRVGGAVVGGDQIIHPAEDDPKGDNRTRLTRP